MNAMQWTVEQLLKRSQLIETLYASADPGTFSNLEDLTLSELEELTSVMDQGETE